MTHPSQSESELEQTQLARTPLAAHLFDAAMELSLQRYCGAETIACFNSVDDEVRTLLNGAGVYDLGYLALFRVTGEDRGRWLNGMLTNTAQGLAQGELNYNFVLNPQGRIQGDLHLYHAATHYVIETTRDQVETLIPLLDRYIIMDDVEIAPEDNFTVLGISGPHAAQALQRAGISVMELQPLHFAEGEWQGHKVTVAHRFSPAVVTHYEIWCDKAAAPRLWQALVDAGAAPVGSDAIEQLRILEVRPRMGLDIRNKDLPQETGQTRALHFAKGCYIGQEIVERIRSRGNVHRAFTAFLVEDSLPSSGAPLTFEDKPAGELTSVSSIQTEDGQQHVALGYIRRELLKRGAVALYEGGSAVPVKQPLDHFPRSNPE